MTSFDGIVLCGGEGRRLGHADKGAIEVAGATLLERAVTAVDAATRVIAVGPRRDLRRPSGAPVTWTIEDPPGGGPAAAIAAGLAETKEPVVVVLGVDFPFVDGACVARLVDACERSARDGVIVRDASGRHQFVVGAYRREALVAALRGNDPHGLSVRDLVAALDLDHLDDPRAATDCDTWVDVERARALLGTEHAS